MICDTDGRPLLATEIDGVANRFGSCKEGLRELLISYGKISYVALYSYEQRQDVVLVLAMRHQREAGYST
jgi:hypothetical protein